MSLIIGTRTNCALSLSKLREKSVNENRRSLAILLFPPSGPSSQVGTIVPLVLLEWRIVRRRALKENSRESRTQLLDNLFLSLFLLFSFWKILGFAILIAVRKAAFSEFCLFSPFERVRGLYSQAYVYWNMYTYVPMFHVIMRSTQRQNLKGEYSDILSISEFAKFANANLLPLVQGVYTYMYVVRAIKNKQTKKKHTRKYFSFFPPNLCIHIYR